jgi:CRISPR-associated protein Cmr6
MDGRRHDLQSLNQIPSTAHAGLWIDKLLPDQEKGKGEKKAEHFKQAIRTVDSLYKQFYERWQRSLAEIGAQTKPAEVLGRLSIGLGGESVLETSISLHRTYGVPYIPGSALKGLAARYARKRLDDWTAEHSKILFGDTDVAGYITFYDALYIPGSANPDIPLALDVMNVHHPEYYRGDKTLPPADWDSPTPVSFLSATGSYLVALHGSEEWVKAAFEILSYALKEEGIGAKTSSGYGRMELEGEAIRSTSISQTQQTVAAVPKPLPVGYQRGRVKSFGLGDNKSYGFIEVQGMGDVFVHRNNLAGNLKDLQPGQRVIFRIKSEKGKNQAEDVRLEE